MIDVYSKDYQKLHTDINFNQLKSIIKNEVDKSEKITTGAGKHKIKICLLETGFDIETTKISNERSYMYHAQVSLNNKIITMRKWSEYETLIFILNAELKKHNSHAYMLIANAGFEFQYIRKHFDISDVFARKARHPISFKIDRVIFLDCLMITGGNLENLAKNYCTTKKLVGDLDYSIIRNSQTKLTETELKYCINDVVILQEFAHYLFEKFLKGMGYIPKTQTGIVRQQMRERFKGDKKHYKYIHDNYLTRLQYNTYSRFLFRGGYVHANAKYVNEILENVESVDFTSSYPAVMNQKYFPVSKFSQADIKEFSEFKADNCYIVCVDFYNIKAKTDITIESKHKIVNYNNDIVLDNGRLYSCSKVRVYLTEIDVKIYNHFYEWSEYKIVKSWTAKKGKLPFQLLENLNEWYCKKKELKKAGLDDALDYVLAKQYVNSHYGMCVTNLSFIDVLYNNDSWEIGNTEKSYKSLISKEFLLYQWGIYITAHARYNLLSCVAKMDNVVYCDTDSIYFLSSENNTKVVKEYNEKIMKKNKVLFDNKNLQDLGLFDYQPLAKKFKTLGCKRYIYTYEKNGNTKLKQTIAGLPKKTLENWKNIENKTYDDVFELFNNKMCISSKYSNKLTTFYNDDEHTDLVIDNQGNAEYMHELSSVTLNESDYNLSISEEWEEFLIENYDIQFKNPILLD